MINFFYTIANDCSTREIKNSIFCISSLGCAVLNGNKSIELEPVKGISRHKCLGNINFIILKVLSVGLFYSDKLPGVMR